MLYLTRQLRPPVEAIEESAKQVILVTVQPLKGAFIRDPLPGQLGEELVGRPVGLKAHYATLVHEGLGAYLADESPTALTCARVDTSNKTFERGTDKSSTSSLKLRAEAPFEAEDRPVVKVLSSQGEAQSLAQVSCYELIQNPVLITTESTEFIRYQSTRFCETGTNAKIQSELWNSKGRR
jgi:hypothetical protein